MGRRLFTNARLADPEGPLDGEPQHGSLLVEDGRIAARIPGEGAPTGIDAEVVDLDGAWLAPGFLDLHVHGELAFAGADEVEGAIARSSASMPRHGVTGFLATTVALERSQLERLVRALAIATWTRRKDAARVLGIHLEGPWIAPRCAGAQPLFGIRPPQHDEVEALLAAGGGAIRMVTLAPEVEGADALLRSLTARSVVPALGHSSADALCVERAIDLGLRHVTHLFNAMTPLHHRDLGVAGAALCDDRLSCDLIADGVHVHRQVVRAAARVKGPRLLLVTDRVDLPRTRSIDRVGLPLDVRSDGTVLRLADGRLAGSCLTLDGAVRNVTQWGAMTRVEAIAACTLRPARLLGIEAERGTLRPGARADLVALDRAGAVRATWIEGRCVYGASEA